MDTQNQNNNQNSSMLNDILASSNNDAPQQPSQPQPQPLQPQTIQQQSSGLQGGILKPDDYINNTSSVAQPSQPYQAPESSNQNLVDILKQANIPTSEPGINAPDNSGSSGQKLPPKPPKKSMSVADFSRIFGSIFLAGIVLFSAFIAYIVFNPDQASFFITLGINPKDIKILLQQLVNATFGMITGFVSVISLIFLFRAFVTKKQFAKKKTISTILAIFFIIILFAEITLWAWLVKIIGATNYVNPNGGVIIYDNDKSKSDKFKDGLDEMKSFDNLIGPITLRFDLSEDARFVQQKHLDISGFQLDYDGDGKVDKQGIDPLTDKGVIFTYEKKGSYIPTGKYIGKDKVTGKPKDFPMKLPAINVLGTIKLSQKNDRMGGKRAFFDLSDIKQLGRVDFYLEDDKGKFEIPDSSYDGTDKFSPQQTFKTESLVCILIKNNQKTPGSCDKVFIVGNEGQANFGGEILEERDPANPLNYNFSFKPNDKGLIISSYEWIVDKNSVVSTDEMFEYAFLTFTKHDLRLNLKFANGTETTIYKELRIVKPITLAKPLDASAYNTNNSLIRITNNEGKTVMDRTWEKDLSQYHIKVGIPMKLHFDGSFVKTKEATYDLKKVEWDFNSDGKADKIGEKIDYDFLENMNYNIVVTYYFESAIRKDKQSISEKILIEAGKKAIDLNLNITQDSDYAPSVVHFDGSASSAKEGTITKFTYDFGEGRGLQNGDAKQDYKYRFPGEYMVTFTATKDDGSKDSIQKKIILKEANKDVTINTSIASGYVGKNIDFDAVGTQGQVESYVWDFGDGSTSTDPTPSHSFSKAGEFKIKLTVTYADGIIKTGDKYLTVK